MFFFCHKARIYFLDGCSEFGSSDICNYILLATNSPVTTVRLSVYVHFLLILIHAAL